MNKAELIKAIEAHGANVEGFDKLTNPILESILNGYEAQKEFVDLTKTVATLEAEKAELTKTCDELLALQAKSELTQDKSIVIVEHKGETYQVAVPNVTVGGKTLSAQELTKDKEAVAELVKIGSGCLIKKSK